VNTRIAFAGLMLALASLTHPEPSYAAPSPVQVLGETKGLSFNAAGLTTEVWIQVKLPAGMVGVAITPKVQSVLFDKKPDDQSLKSFKADKVFSATKDQQSTIVLTVTEIDKLPPGVYTLTFTFSGGNVELEPLTLDIERRAAQLAPMPKQVVDVSWGAMAAASAAPQSLRINALSDRRSSALRQASVSQSLFTESGGSQSSGQLRPTLPASSANAGEGLEINFSPKDFAVGTATGKVVIDSPDLKTPFSFEVEVRTKRAGLWLVVTVLLGMLAGFVLRVLMQHRLELRTAQEQGADLLLKARLELERTPDQTFQKDVLDAIVALEAAVTAEKTTDITTAVSQLETKFQEALTSLSQRLEQLRTEVQAAAELAATPGLLPASLRDTLSTLGTRAEQAVGMIRSRDGDGAKQVLATAQRLAFADLLTQGGQEQTLFKLAANTYEAMLPLLKAASQDEIKGLIAADGLTPPASMTDLASAKNYVDGWLAAARARQSSMTLLAKYLSKDAQSLAELAGDRAAMPASRLAEATGRMRAATQTLADEVDSLIANGTPFAEPTLDAAPALSARRDLLLKVRTSRSNIAADAAAAYDQQFNNGHFFEALKTLPVLSQEEEDANKELNASSAPSVPPQPGPNEEESVTRSESSAAAAPLGRRFTSTIKLDSSQELRAFRGRTHKEIAAITGINTAAAAIIFGIASYAIFGERFIGTYSELAGLFFWGFTADLSVAKLTELSGGLAAKPKA